MFIIGDIVYDGPPPAAEQPFTLKYYQAERDACWSRAL